jgi:hypothetical protein
MDFSISISIYLMLSEKKANIKKNISKTDVAPGAI